MLKPSQIVTIGVIVLIAACASFSQNAYKSLAVSQQTYDATLSALGDLYKQGKVSEAVKTKVIEAGTLYKTAHNQAVQALLNYDMAVTQADQEQMKKVYMTQIAEASKQLAVLLELARP